MPAPATQPHARAISASERLRQFIASPDDPAKLRVWPGRTPPIAALQRLVDEAEEALILVSVDFADMTATETRISPTVSL